MTHTHDSMCEQILDTVSDYTLKQIWLFLFQISGHSKLKEMERPQVEIF